MTLDSTQTVVSSLDATVFSATKNNESAQVGIIKIIPEQPEPFDESEYVLYVYSDCGETTVLINPPKSLDLTYCPKGIRDNPYRGGITPGQASGKKAATSTQSSNPSHRSAANPRRVANLAHGTNSTKASQSSSKDKNKGK